MPKPALLIVATVGSLGLVLTLTGCSTGYPDIAGVWTASDGSASKVISDDGNCNNMLYDGNTMQEIAKPGMCAITGVADGGGYTLKVEQTGQTATYTATFSDHDDTIALSEGGHTFVTLTRAPSVD